MRQHPLSLVRPQNRLGAPTRRDRRQRRHRRSWRGSAALKKLAVVDVAAEHFETGVGGRVVNWDMLLLKDIAHIGFGEIDNRRGGLAKFFRGGGELPAIFVAHRQRPHVHEHAIVGRVFGESLARRLEKSRRRAKCRRYRRDWSESPCAVAECAPWLASEISASSMPYSLALSAIKLAPAPLEVMTTIRPPRGTGWCAANCALPRKVSTVSVEIMPNWRNAAS